MKIKEIIEKENSFMITLPYKFNQEKDIKTGKEKRRERRKLKRDKKK